MKITVGLATIGRMGCKIHILSGTASTRTPKVSEALWGDPTESGNRL